MGMGSHVRRGRKAATRHWLLWVSSEPQITMAHLTVILSLIAIAVAWYFCARVKAPFNLLAMAGSASLIIMGCVSVPDLRRLYWERRFHEELPPGSSLDRVRGFFDAAHTDYDFDARSHTLYAIERDISAFLIVSYGIAIQCQFTEASILKSCTAEVYGDGP
jgi:hypothetical protein